MQKITLIWFVGILLLFFGLTFNFSQNVLAEDGTIELNMPFDEENKTMDVKNKNSFEIVSEYVSMVYKWGAVVTGLIAVLMVVVGGVQYILAGADPGQKDDAKDRIKQALLALTLLLLSGLILKTINPRFFQFF